MRDKFFQKINGLPVGLSISPILADLVLQDVEEIFLQGYKESISFYGRYGGDTLIAITKIKLGMPLNLLNRFPW